MMHRGLASKTAGMFVDSKLTPLVVVVILLLGFIAILYTPREEEPQIRVPMINVMIPYPGATPREVEEHATTPTEKLLWGLPRVKYVYSKSFPGGALITVRFKVGTHLEQAVVSVHHRLREYLSKKPNGVYFPLIKSYTIDDVPFLAVTLHSRTSSPLKLRQVAQELARRTNEIKDISKINIIGGDPRQLRIIADSKKLDEYNVSFAEFFPNLKSGNTEMTSGHLKSDPEAVVQTGDFFKNADEVKNIVIGLKNGKIVRIKDVARVIDGPAERDKIVKFANKGKPLEDAVTLSFAKRKGTNATVLSNAVLHKIDHIKNDVIPKGIEYTVTRNYGKTAKDKSDSLLRNLIIATITVVFVIALVIGLKFSLVIGIAVPTSLALTLFVYYIFGYTINRVTLFALIMTIGIIVDNAIVVVENVARHIAMPEHHEKGRSLTGVILYAVEEVGTPTILATIVIVAAILPMAFVSGLMGPYMSPIPIGASVAMTFSLLIAFIVTPWMTKGVVKKAYEQGTAAKMASGTDKLDWIYRIYKRAMAKLVDSGKNSIIFFTILAILLAGSVSLIAFSIVKVKMLPFDNKSEIQIVVDGDDGLPVQNMLSIEKEMAKAVQDFPEVENYEIYAGTASPMTFNGLVRQYFLRQAPYLGDIHVNLAPKSERKRQSHAIAKSMRPIVKAIADKYGIRVKVVEIPPGPPVLSTLVSEVFGPDFKGQLEVASKIKKLYKSTSGVVDVDWLVDNPANKITIDIDRDAASVRRLPVDRIVKVAYGALNGAHVGDMHTAKSWEPVPIRVRLDINDRRNIDSILNLKVPTNDMSFVPIKEVTHLTKGKENISIFHKNLQRVVYVTGDVAGAKESPIYAISAMKNDISDMTTPNGGRLEQRYISQPMSTDGYSMKWDGEWQITYEVFRDLGISFALVMILIYIIIVGWFQSFLLPVILMVPIPLSLIGVIPGHGMIHAFVTATSMIGAIACAGIIVRNSILLIDFIELKLIAGESLRQATIDAGVVRFRPILLTAGTVVAGTFVMLFDPIFQGMALSLMWGEGLAIIMTPVAIPLLYYWIMGTRRLPFLKEHAAHHEFE